MPNNPAVQRSLRDARRATDEAKKSVDRLGKSRDGVDPAVLDALQKLGAAVDKIGKALSD